MYGRTPNRTENVPQDTAHRILGIRSAATASVDYDAYADAREREGQADRRMRRMNKNYLKEARGGLAIRERGVKIPHRSQWFRQACEDDEPRTTVNGAAPWRGERLSHRNVVVEMAEGSERVPQAKEGEGEHKRKCERECVPAERCDEGERARRRTEHMHKNRDNQHHSGTISASEASAAELWGPERRIESDARAGDSEGERHNDEPPEVERSERLEGWRGDGEGEPQRGQGEQAPRSEAREAPQRHKDQTSNERNIREGRGNKRWREGTNNLLTLWRGFNPSPRDGRTVTLDRATSFFNSAFRPMQEHAMSTGICTDFVMLASAREGVIIDNGGP
ncbi:hypothetical protein C8R45DRAFT_1082519 [Mycena sanguinolenta]|nr:hypothetical protein C8R45DRAFT_1082519 [Mycena sanguinolenta]